MKYTKELVSSRDINTKCELGILHQPVIDDFMGDFDVMDFIKPFYLERIWKVNGVLDDNNNPFSLFCVLTTKEPDLEKNFMSSLSILYPNKQFKVTDINKKGCIIIHNDENKPVAVINDDNFDKLCEIVVQMAHYEDPKPQPKEEKKDKALEEYEKLEAMMKEKHKKKSKGFCFEERVRQLIHMKDCFYKDIKDLTLWQFEDFYKTLFFMNDENRTYQFASSGNFKINLKDVKNWRELTKIEREDAE